MRALLVGSVITSMSVAAENFPFCTIEPHHAVVPIQDLRIDRLASIY